MAEKRIPQMTDDFLQLCRAINLGQDLEFCKRRWLGVWGSIKGIEQEHVEAMIRVVFRSKQQAEKKILDGIRQNFKVADESFPMSGNDPEIEAMCAAILLCLFSTKDDIAPLTALAVTTASMFGGRKPVVSLDLVGRAEEALSNFSRYKRQRPDLDKLTSAISPKVDFSDAITKVEKQVNPEAVKASLSDIASEVERNLNILQSLVSKAVAKVNQFFAIQDEELQMLWWLIGGRSWSENRRFSEVSPSAQPLVFAKELADFTNICPGPESINGLLSHAGLREVRDMTVPEAINAYDQERLSVLAEGISPSPVTLPIHFGIMRKMETRDNDSWIKGWAATADLEIDRKLTALALGELFYRERIQINLLKG